MTPRLPDDTASFDPEEETLEKLVAPQAGPRKYKYTWSRIIQYSYFHFAAFNGLYLLCASASWSTIAFNCLAYYLTMIGVTAGAHRLWAHKTYKAKIPLQIFLMLCHSMSYQHSLFMWVRDHRLHHKYSDTDADPHNASRGFFYSHVGWTVVNRHPELVKRAKLLDLSDMLKNTVVMFQKRNIKWMNPVFTLVIPTLIPMYFWHETFSVAYHVNVLRFILSLNSVFMVNSFAHMFGTKPYDKGIEATQNFLVILLTLGEGFHNYHHTFPYDYRTGELGSMLNFSTSFIDLCAWLGLAYDRRSVSPGVIEKRIIRSGDGRQDKYGMVLG